MDVCGAGAAAVQQQMDAGEKTSEPAVDDELMADGHCSSAREQDARRLRSGPSTMEQWTSWLEDMLLSVQQRPEL